jgi:peptidoglycan/xylan/chitin deacetylase (PgdA/CDA1 family)
MLELMLGPAGDAPESLLPLTWDMVRALNRAGVAIGSHTRTHPVLTTEDHANVVQELVASRASIERELGAAVLHFAYPDGGFSAPVVAAVADAGYSFAYTTCRHRDTDHPELTIPRRFLWENSCLDAHGRFSPPVMSCLTNGVYDLAVSCRRPHHTATVADVEHREPTAPAIG